MLKCRWRLGGWPFIIATRTPSPPHLRSAAGVHPLTPELTSEGWRGVRALAAMKLLMAAVMNLMIDGGDDRLALTLYSRAVSHGHWGPRAPLPL